MASYGLMRLGEESVLVSPHELNNILGPERGLSTIYTCHMQGRLPYIDQT